jgi:serine protease Do
MTNRFVPAGISLGREFTALAERLRSITVRVLGAGSSQGSGILWGPDGLVLTNAHVLVEPPFMVETADGRVHRATLVSRDATRDLAALQIAVTNMPWSQVRDCGSLRAGEIVVAVGNPMGTTGGFTAGVLSAKPKRNDLFLRADIRLAPGYSGGPLGDAGGRVIGVNSMMVDGFGIAVTSSAVERFLTAQAAGRLAKGA